MYIIKSMPKMKSRQTAKRARQSRAKRARHRTYKKGGMFRRASAMRKTVFKQVIGEGLERLDKAKQVGEAVEKGMRSQSRASEFKSSVMPAQFSFGRKSASGEMHRHSSRDSAYNDAIHKTPMRPTANDEPPKLDRVRHRETDEERRRRLGLIAAPAMHNNIVKELFTH